MEQKIIKYLFIIYVLLWIALFYGYYVRFLAISREDFGYSHRFAMSIFCKDNLSLINPIYHHPPAFYERCQSLVKPQRPTLKMILLKSKTQFDFWRTKFRRSEFHGFVSSISELVECPIQVLVIHDLAAEITLNNLFHQVF